MNNVWTVKNEGDKINLLPKYILNLSLLNPCCHCPTSAITSPPTPPPAQLPASLLWGLFAPIAISPYTHSPCDHPHARTYLSASCSSSIFFLVHLICYSASLQPQILFPCSRFIVDGSTYRVAKHENSVSSSFKSGPAQVSLSGVNWAHRIRLSSVQKQSLYQRMETCERKPSLAVASGGGQGCFSGI